MSSTRISCFLCYFLCGNLLTWKSRGEKLSITATGDFKKEVGEGFMMHLQVKYGLITLINQQADGCDTIGKADLECPLKKGEMKLTKDVDLPREIPPVCFSTLLDRPKQ